MKCSGDSTNNKMWFYYYHYFADYTVANYEKAEGKKITSELRRDLCTKTNQKCKETGKYPVSDYQSNVG